MSEVERRIRAHFSEAFGLSEMSVEGLVTTSRKALGEGLDALARAVARDDAAEVERWAHSLKGNLLNAGLEELAQVATSLEFSAATGLKGGLEGRVDSLRQGLAAFLGRE